MLYFSFVLRHVVVVCFPIPRIVRYVLSDFRQFAVVPDNVVVVIALPNRLSHTNDRRVALWPVNEHNTVNMIIFIQAHGHWGRIQYTFGANLLAKRTNAQFLIITFPCLVYRALPPS